MLLKITREHLQGNLAECRSKLLALLIECSKVPQAIVEIDQSDPQVVAFTAAVLRDLNDLGFQTKEHDPQTLKRLGMIEYDR